MSITPAAEQFTLVGLPAEERRADFARDAAAGLNASPKSLPCVYFYDRLGSKLFEAICELPEYYLTRAEESILRKHSAEIAGLFPGPTDLVELGSGNSAKTRLLIESFLARKNLRRYVPLDICRPVLEETSAALLRDYPALKILAVAGEYREGLEHLRAAADSSRLVLWLGSNVGNLDRPEAGRFLRQVRDTLRPGDGVLVGVDLRKDPAVLEAAYDDACGVTAAFNRNILVRLNAELGGDLDVRAFRHRARYNDADGRVEMYLVSKRRQLARIDGLGLTVSFAAGEAVHTENSYKYSPAEIDALAAAAGMQRERHWLDEQGRFSLNLLTPLG